MGLLVLVEFPSLLFKGWLTYKAWFFVNGQTFGAGQNFRFLLLVPPVMLYDPARG